MDAEITWPVPCLPLRADAWEIVVTEHSVPPKAPGIWWLLQVLPIEQSLRFQDCVIFVWVCERGRS